MRLLHTSDWHLGRSFHGTALLEEQAAVLERITAIAADAAVDAVVIAGDLYDRAIPPADAVRLFDSTVRRLRVEVVPLGVGRPLRTIEGPLAALLADPALAEAAQARLRVILTDPSLPLQAMARLRPRFPHIAELRHRPPERPGEGAVARAERIGPQLSPLERSLAFFADQQGRAAEEPERRLLREALEAAGRAEER